MSLKRFSILVDLALARLPPEILKHLENVIIDIEDEPSHDLLRDLGFTEAEIEAGEELFGLFEPMIPDLGEDLWGPSKPPFRIIIFRRPLQRAFPDRRQLMVEIGKTVVHEALHGLGLTDSDLEAWDDHPNPFSK